MHVPRRFRTLLLLLVLTAGAAAQSPGTPGKQPAAEQLQRAATAFAAGDWQAANNAYVALAAQFPAHGLSRFRVGVTLVELGRGAEAVPHLREGERLGIPSAQASYRLAQAFAVQDRGDDAMGELQRGLAAGFAAPASFFRADRHLSRLASHAQWTATIDAYDAVVQPCRHGARFREFDFWLGDWDVRATGVPATGPASRNRITLEENGCVVQEHWTGQGGSTGQSFNLFDRSIGKWRQTWVDNIGGQHDYVGERRHGNMVFEGTTPAPGGQAGRLPTRLTLFHVSADAVRQFSEVSADSGRTWTVAYDLTYVRRKP